MIIIYVLIGIIVIALLAGIAIYNKLVRLRNTVKSSWSDIDVQCKKRYDLVPNLVETVKGYASHEKAVFEKVTQARSMAMQATSPAEVAKAENMLRDTLKSLFAVAEAYPELKANASFLAASIPASRNWKTTLNLREDITMRWSGIITS